MQCVYCEVQGHLLYIYCMKDITKKAKCYRIIVFCLARAAWEVRIHLQGAASGHLDTGLTVSASKYCDGSQDYKVLMYVRSRFQKFPAWHTEAAPNGKFCEGYIVPSMVRLMYQLKSVLK